MKAEEEMTTELVESTPHHLAMRETPQTILDKAIASGIPASELIALATLYEADISKKAFAAAKVRCKAELPIVVRDAVNKHTNSKYAKLENVSQTIDPITTRHGFTNSFSTRTSEKEKCVTITMRVQHEAGHFEDVELLDVPFDNVGPKGNDNKTPIQGMVSSLSYAQRKLKLMYWDVTVADEDRDGNLPDEPITQKQVEQIRDLLFQTNSDAKRFLKWAGVDRIEDMCVAKFREAVKMLEAKPKA